MSRWTLVVAGLRLTAGSSTEWVQPIKPSSEFAGDYNNYEAASTRDPMLQQGRQLLLLNATKRYVQKEDWRLIEQ